MAWTRSITGCLACKTKRKKCDETKPHCLRCQKSRIECPGYTYVSNSSQLHRKLRTLPAPRTVAGRSRAIPDEGTALANAEKPGVQVHNQPSLGYALSTTQALASAPGSFVEENVATPPEPLDILNKPSLKFFQHSSIDPGRSHGLVVNTVNLGPILSPQNIRVATPMTSGQTSLLEALFSLGQSPDQDRFPQSAQLSSGFLSDLGGPFAPNLSPSNIKRWDDIMTYDDHSPGGAANTICCELALDMTTESNALPFVLQGYVGWINRLAFEPLKMAGIARDFVFSQFADGEQSRWIVVLIANIGSRIGGVEVVKAKHSPMLCALQTAVRRRLEAVKFLRDPQSAELVKTFHCAVEAILIQFYAGPMNEAVSLMQETAPIFRQFCPDPPNAPIDLFPVLQHPLSCVRQYARFEILFNLGADRPPLFRYDVTIQDSQPPNSHSVAPANQSDGVTQWMHGIPDQILLLLAKMNAIRQDRPTRTEGVIASFEQGIRDLQPYSGSSSERFLVVMRCTVHECWRQFAFVYLYMALCGDPCNTARVKKALKQFMKLLKGVKPGRVPDEFLIMPLLLIAPAVQRDRDRKIITERIRGLNTPGRTLRDNVKYTCVMEDFWARADVEGRPTVWSDVGVSQRRTVSL